MSNDFSLSGIKSQAVSLKPMTFMEQDSKNALTAVMEIIAIEASSRPVRELWQTRQLLNILNFADERSAFWHHRIGSQTASGQVNFAGIPVLTRADIRAQFSAEGSLLRPENQLEVFESETSGSSGVPVRFYVSSMNTAYNINRNAAQYFIEGRDFSLNRTQVLASSKGLTEDFVVNKMPEWGGQVLNFIKTGTNKLIHNIKPEPLRIIEELKKDKIGYLVLHSWIMEALLQYCTPSDLKDWGTEMWIPIGSGVDDGLYDKFHAAGIKIRSTYSAQEVGLIGSECLKHNGFYHVANSNVTVESDLAGGEQVGDRRLGRLLITHLHSYAMPFIRYDIGDLGHLENDCPCGHDGPTLSAIYGRGKNLIKKADGRLHPFHIRVGNHPWLARYPELRFRQTAIDTITVEVGGGTALSESEISDFLELVQLYAGSDMMADIRAVQNIDWREDRKKLLFRNVLLS